MTGEPLPQPARRREGGLESVHVLGLVEDGEASLVIPEARLLHRRERRILPSAQLSLDRAPNPAELIAQVAGSPVVSLAMEGKRAQVEGGWRLRVSVTLALCSLCSAVRVDEADLDSGGPGADEEELVSLRDRLLDDRARDLRQQVLVERALERPGAEFGAESLLDQEGDRRLVQLDRPRPRAKPTPRERVGELLIEQRSHLGALEGLEDHDLVDPVQELGPKRPLQLALDQLLAEAPVPGLEADAGLVRERRADV